MKNIRNAFIVIAVLTLVFSSLTLAQEKVTKTDAKNGTSELCTESKQCVKHECSDECKEKCCTHHAEKQASANAHVHTDECKEKGCEHVKAMEARAALDVNKDGYIYECPMKCETADVPGECSKCGMKLKKVSVK